MEIHAQRMSFGKGENRNMNTGRLSSCFAVLSAVSRISDMNIMSIMAIIAIVPNIPVISIIPNMAIMDRFEKLCKSKEFSGN